jgi:LacI family transcriptional regulator
MKDFARTAGVSIATVSNVINRPDLVSERTSVKVRSVIDELGFVPNNSARQLRAGTSPMISVIVPDIANPFFAELTRGVEARAVEHDLAVFVSSTEGDVDREHRYLNVVIGQRPRGVLFTPAGDLERPLSVLGNRLPVVLIDRESSGSLCSVAVDDFRGGGLAVQHLHTLGHKALTWVAGPDSIPQCAQRTAGIRYAAAQLGMTITEVRVISMTVAEGKLAAATLRSGPLPTAVVCANDLLALGVEFGLLTADVAVPATTSIIGFDDIEFAASAAVTLTTVTRPAFDIGATALEMLLSERHDPDHRHRQVQFQPKISIRNSTAPPPNRQQ